MIKHILRILFDVHIDNNDKIASAIILIATHRKKLIKIFRNSSIEIEVEIVASL